LCQQKLAGGKGKTDRPKADKSNNKHVAASMPGSMVRLLVKEGDTVTKGQVLIVCIIIIFSLFF
jgi:pyruvate carboxylase